MEENQELNQEQEQHEEQEERRFTQAEVDAIVNKRYAKWKKDQPSDDELTKFREWQKAQQTPEEKEAVTQAKIDSALAEAEMVRRENWLLRQGVDPDDVDYYVYKIGKTMDGETEFEDAAKKFLRERKPRTGVRVDMGGRLSGGSGKKTANETMNDLLRAARG